MRCGGPALCSECAADAYRARAALAQPSPAQAEAERPEGPTEDELEAAGLGYPLHKEEAVKLWYSGFRSEVITVLEAWEAIGHDIGMNPDKGELLDSLRYMLEKCEAHDAALAEVAGLRSLLNSLLCYVERDIDRMRSDRDKSDNKEIYDRSISLAMERLKAAQNAVFTTEPGCDTAVELAAQTTQAQHSVPVAREQLERLVRILDAHNYAKDAEALMALLAAAPAQAQHSVPVAREQLERLVRILDAHNYAKDAEALMALLAAAPAQAQHSVPEISGIGRDAEHPRAVVLYLRNEPSEEDMRAIQNFLRAISADVLTQAQHSVPVAREQLERLVRILDAHNYAKDAEALMALLAAAPAQAQHSVPVAREQLERLVRILDAHNYAKDAEALMALLAAAPAQAQHSVPELLVRAEDFVSGKEVPQAWLDVQAERRRQITAEGWTPEHDDLYCAAELPRAAAAYILNGANDEAPAIWPFSAKWWKPRDARSNYVRAGALILAEIERLDRAAPGKEVGHE
ncbi:hypothetical protein ACSETL_02875 [Pseudomonas aeruginosa]